MRLKHDGEYSQSSIIYIMTIFCFFQKVSVVLIIPFYDSGECEFALEMRDTGEEYSMEIEYIWSTINYSMNLICMLLPSYRFPSSTVQTRG